MILYHGSQYIVRQPIFGYGSQANDFGRGFYCTESLELAKEWACMKNHDGYANKYRLSLDGLNVVNLNSPEFNILNWIAVLTKNRTFGVKGSLSSEAMKYLQKTFLPDLSRYDLIQGYRADDSYFSFARAFVSNAISVQQLGRAMMLGNLGEQIVLVSQKAFQQIEFLEAIQAESEEYFRAANARDKEARQSYRQIAEEAGHMNDLFMVDILRRGMTNDDINRLVR